MFLLTKFRAIDNIANLRKINIRSYLRNGKLVRTSVRNIKKVETNLVSKVTNTKQLNYYNTEYRNKLTNLGKSEISNWSNMLKNNVSKTTDWDDSVSVLDYIKEDIKDNPNSFRSVIHEGKTMSMMTVEPDKINKCLKINNLLSNPERLVTKSSSGAGIVSIIHAVEESIDLGYNGKLKLTSLPKASRFYEKLGFERIGSEFSFQYVLNAEKAQQLIDNHLNSLSSFSNSDYKDAVELDKTITAFAIKKLS